MQNVTYVTTEPTMPCSYPFDSSKRMVLPPTSSGTLDIMHQLPRINSPYKMDISSVKNAVGLKREPQQKWRVTRIHG